MTCTKEEQRSFIRFFNQRSRQTYLNLKVNTGPVRRCMPANPASVELLIREFQNGVISVTDCPWPRRYIEQWSQSRVQPYAGKRRLTVSGIAVKIQHITSSLLYHSVIKCLQGVCHDSFRQKWNNNEPVSAKKLSSALKQKMTVSFQELFLEMKPEFSTTSGNEETVQGMMPCLLASSP